MTSTTQQLQQQTHRPKVNKAARFAKYFSYYGLVLVIAWIGWLKFTPAEAAAISGFAQHSPLFSWAYKFGSAQAVSNFIGCIELIIAVLIALRPLSPVASAIGGLGAIGMFLSTLSFLFTTPGIVTGLTYGMIPALSVPGQFLLKDVVLLGVAIQVFVDSIKRSRMGDMQDG